MPRYAQLADLFRARIERGTWQRNSMLPTIEQLMSEFDVARVTVRQAVSLLAREGLLSPQRGRGTFVKEPVARGLPLRLGMTLDDLALLYRDDKPQLTLIEQSSITPQLADGEGKLALKYRFMRRVHVHSEEPYCVISIYLDERVFRMAPRRFRRELVIPVLRTLPSVKIAKAWQTLTVGSADVEISELLGVSVNAPVACVRRVFTANDGTVTYLAEVTYRSDYVRVEMDLMP